MFTSLLCPCEFDPALQLMVLQNRADMQACVHLNFFLVFVNLIHSKWCHSEVKSPLAASTPKEQLFTTEKRNS